MHACSPVFPTFLEPKQKKKKKKTQKKKKKKKKKEREKKEFLRPSVKLLNVCIYIII
jgi:hypothetical protein